MVDDELRTELLRRAERDQAARRRIELDPEAVMAIDAENLPWLEQTIAEKGWPTRSMVGEEASRAAWLLVQHADRRPAFQRHCLELLTAAADAGEAEQTHVAYLTDRVRLATGRPQVYGTQVTAREGQWVPRALENPDAVDDRRAAVGLEPLKDYLAWFGDPPRPNILPCHQCASPIEFWTPEPGQRLQLECPACGWTTTLSIDPP